MSRRNANTVRSTRGLRRAGIAAGFMVLVLVVGLFVTSLLRVPDPTWSVLLAVLAVGIAITLASSLRGRDRRR